MALEDFFLFCHKELEKKLPTFVQNLLSTFLRKSKKSLKEQHYRSLGALR